MLHIDVGILLDLTGQTFGRLTVVGRAPDHVEANKRCRTMWLCKCSCGELHTVRGHHLKCGKTSSCGCIRIEQLVDRAHKRTVTDPQMLAERKARYKSKNIEAYRKRKYGMAQLEYERLVKKQNNECAICKNIMSRPHVDHCHTHGHTRELLCRQCNLMLGFAEDDIKKLHSAIRYLEKHNVR